MGERDFILPAVGEFMEPSFSIVVPNWNGEAFAGRCISSLLMAARATRLPFEFIVVDDASTDGAPDTISRTFPGVTLLRNDRNLGFGPTVMRGMREARAPLAILANNDLAAKEDFIARLIAPFEADAAKTLFGVSARTVNWTDGAPNHLNMTAHFRRGLVELDFEDSQEMAPTLFLQGGACCVRREAFLEMGGFAEIFRPGYWEDYDLSYQAAKRGWRLLYEPAALAFHLGKGSLMKVLGREGIHTVSARNYFYFTWLNLTDSRMMLEHFLYLPLHIASELYSPGKPLRLLRGFLKALPGFFRVLGLRRLRKGTGTVPDRALLKAGIQFQIKN